MKLRYHLLFACFVFLTVIAAPVKNYGDKQVDLKSQGIDEAIESNNTLNDSDVDDINDFKKWGGARPVVRPPVYIRPPVSGSRPRNNSANSYNAHKSLLAVTVLAFFASK